MPITPEVGLDDPPEVLNSRDSVQPAELGVPPARLDMRLRH